MSGNLFSVFEPSAIWGLSLNWLSLGCFLFLPVVFQTKPTNLISVFQVIKKGIDNNSKETLSMKTSPVSGIVLLSILVWVGVNNFLGLGPYLFTASSHLVFGMALSLPVWVGYMWIYVWYFNEEMMSHLIPSGTPLALVGLMILIESVSTMIRPATLMFRLTANMIAGHLLLVLLSNSAMASSAFLMAIVLGALVLLLLLEVSVSFIQAYVFYLLTSLYLVDLVGSASNAKSQILSQSL